MAVFTEVGFEEAAELVSRLGLGALKSLKPIASGIENKHFQPAIMAGESTGKPGRASADDADVELACQYVWCNQRHPFPPNKRFPQNVRGLRWAGRARMAPLAVAGSRSCFEPRMIVVCGRRNHIQRTQYACVHPHHLLSEYSSLRSIAG